MGGGIGHHSQLQPRYLIFRPLLSAYTPLMLPLFMMGPCLDVVPQKLKSWAVSQTKSCPSIQIPPVIQNPTAGQFKKHPIRIQLTGPNLEANQARKGKTEAVELRQDDLFISLAHQV